MADAVRELFQWQTLRGLLHLIHDTRPAEGLGQSEFVRGLAEAGATWWIETLWGAEGLGPVRQRIGQGPPKTLNRP